MDTLAPELLGLASCRRSRFLSARTGKVARRGAQVSLQFCVRTDRAVDQQEQFGKLGIVQKFLIESVKQLVSDLSERAARKTQKLRKVRRTKPVESFTGVMRR